MRRVLATSLALAACVMAPVHGLIDSTFKGAMNSRLSHEQLAATHLGDIRAQYFSQDIDHTQADVGTYAQKYYVNDTFYDPLNPRVFLILGGEGPIAPNYVTNHYITGELSAKYNAMVIALEHRFYGESIPNGGDPSVANLKYLSSQQALADAAAFRNAITEQLGFASSGVQWIVFGGSYSGSLSAWARQLYPTLFDGSIGTSAPVQAQLEFPEYFEVVATSIGPRCASVVQLSTNAVTAKLETSEGVQQLLVDFNLCSAPVTKLDIATFFGALSDPIAETVQYNLDNRPGAIFNIDQMCAILEEPENAYTALVNLWTKFNHDSGQTECNDITYAASVQDLQATSAGRSWTYQTCTEFGYYQTGASSKQPFSALISLELFLTQCSDLFGQGQTPDIDGTNAFYGGNTVAPSNTAMANGHIDPWHILGNYQTNGNNSLTGLMEGTAHCADLYPARASDLPQLTEMRAKEDALIGVWLGVSEKAAKKEVEKIALF